MSIWLPSLSHGGVSRLHEMAQSSALRHGARLVAAPLRFVGFWVAIALPFLYLPLLLGGLSGQEVFVFGALLATNALALVLGHSHGQ